jgi:hypothetical protein
MAERPEPQEASTCKKSGDSSRSALGGGAARRPRRGDPSMWGAIQSAAEDGWGTTTRFGLLLMARYGPHTAMAAIVLRALEVAARHLGAV